MGTKQNPGQFDCYKAAAPNEPLFVLLARDFSASRLVQIWAAIRAGKPNEARTALEVLIDELSETTPDLPRDFEKADEAYGCAVEMKFWYSQNRKR